ncbi:MAG: energy transducer TonB [Sulfurimicrobium sp.]|jgi:protein TonB|nr:energy transducer TonB [Sulfurimicrobium sp.]MDO9188779.1 energy transducer TonB [Sulfurimicrobium sp.]MDP1706106.1 energy transducer TonB [Sulfurimicrobium sp.]MDP1896824.1 energy transducer TonB [Sulfurimicrobium sp.]MDP2199650.1 energy transducer TonB [Sulfurimicrobium sp.]
MADPIARSGAEAAEKLALTLAASLILHFALIFGLQIRVASTVGHSSQVIRAQLVVPSNSIAVHPPAPMLVPEPDMEPQKDAPEVHAAAPVPPPEPPAVAPASAAAPEINSNLPSIEVPLIEDPTYYAAKEVDVHPTALQAIQPFYPEAAASANITGSVVLVLLLDESGKVQELSVEEANPPGTFEQSALDAFRGARFTPAQRNGRVVKSRVRIKVSYELADKHYLIDKAKQK